MVQNYPSQKNAPFVNVDMSNKPWLRFNPQIKFSRSEKYITDQRGN